jgi:hypothetical protein
MYVIGPDLGRSGNGTPPPGASSSDLLLPPWTLDDRRSSGARPDAVAVAVVAEVEGDPGHGTAADTSLQKKYS